MTVLFQRGAFGPTEADATAAALAAYAIGLPAFVLVKVMAPGFFARHDTATPVKIAAVTVAVNIVLTVTLGIIRHRRGHFAIDRQARRRLPRIALAALGMGVLLFVAEALLAPLLAGRL